VEIVSVTIDELLARARSRLDRIEPDDVLAAVDAGALLVDIRPVAQRDADGVVPGAAVVDRNVLEWRLDPASAHRLPEGDQGRRVIVLCNEGYASSLAAATLQDLGLSDATDVIGGYQEWRRRGLPVDVGS
jgi:rhodanese-related sulfurtransferase